MSKRTIVYMLGGSLLVPLGAFLLLIIVPSDYSFAESFSIALGRVWGHAIPMAAFAFWLMVFAGLGGLLARVSA